MNSYDTWLVRVIYKIRKLILSVEDISKLSEKFGSRENINTHILDYSKRIQSSSTTPKGHYGRRYSYVKFTLTDECERILMECASKLDVYFYDYSYLDLSDRVFYIKGKSSAQRFLISDNDSSYRDTHIINKYIKSKEPFEGLFYVEQISADEYKNAPDNKKLKIIKNQVE